MLSFSTTSPRIHSAIAAADGVGRTEVVDVDATAEGITLAAAEGACKLRNRNYEKEKDVKSN